MAGIKQEEKILAIDGQKLVDLSNEIEVLNRIKGKEGIKSVFTIEDHDHHSRDITIVRKKFHIPIFNYKIINSDIAYLKIYQFSPSLQKEFEGISLKLKKDLPRRLIIDLRNNLGGETVSSTFLADQFIKKGVLVREKWRDSQKEDITYTSGKAPFANLPIFVLVNKETSSAAEILTAAIKDYRRGLIIGTNTYGKGTAGYFFELSDGTAIHLTVGKWLTPDDMWINGVGITPDVYVAATSSTQQDEVLEKAISL